MVSKTTFTCDRCHTDVTHSRVVVTTKSTASGSTANYDLCHDCHRTFRSWTTHEIGGTQIEEHRK
jgi:hypothetical protein